MLINTSVMRWAALLANCLLGCTTPNPRSCADGACTEPAFPFCDLDGTLQGEPNTCVAIDCTPLAVVACRGDVELRCNQLGNNLDSTQCQGTCSPSEGCTETRTISIVFETNRDGNFEIYRMNLDGSLQTNLTLDPADDREPRWAPSGDLIAFLSDRSGTVELYVMEPDGANVVNISKGSASEFSWAPDSRHIAFVSDRGGSANLFTVSVDGTGLVPLTQSGGVFSPSWSPDGSTIAYSTTSGIDLISAAGGPASPLVTGIDRFPAWSPDGTAIAFGRRLAFTNFETFLVAPDGTGARNLSNTPTQTETGAPVWSPDGTSIATQGGTDANPELVVIDVAGAGVSNLSMADGIDGNPCWTPDGAQVAFGSNREGQGELYIVPAIGGTALRLTDSAGDDARCSIRPR